MCLCLCVAGPPGNCDILKAISYSSSLTLNVRCFNGNSPITGYLLRFKKKSSSEWTTRKITANSNNTSADMEELVLRGLEANTLYDVQVQAGNAHGYETGSNSFNTLMVRTAGTG